MCHICRFCNKEFKSGQSLGAHIVHCSMNPNSHQEEFQKRKKENFEKQNPLEEHILKCPICGKEYTIQIRHKQFEQGKYKKTCSPECAKKLTALNTNTEEKNKKISTVLKSKGIVHVTKGKHLVNGQWVEKTEQEKNNIRICSYCGKEYSTIIRGRSLYCSNECMIKSRYNKLSQIGKKSAYIQKEQRRSKNEMLFCKLCENEFNNVLHNEPIFNGWDADVILPDYKIAVLWNGKWHYEQIMKGTSLLQIQNRDSIKIKEIKEMNYIPYIIKDTNNYSEVFVKEQFNIFKQYINNIKNNN